MVVSNQKLKGFGTMKRINPKRLAAIAKEAGRLSQELGGGKNRWTPAQAKSQAKKGGLARWKKEKK